MNAHQDWLIWQLADSAFPTGGFGHSGGLEGAWQLGEVRTPTELAGFVESSLRQSGRASVPLVTEAHRDPTRLVELDRFCDVFTSNHIANRASRAQGQAFLASVGRIFSPGALDGLAGWNRLQGSPGHLAPVFGVVTRLLEVRRTAASRLFLFIQLRGWISSAVRLGLIGPIAGQALQHRLSPMAEEVAARSDLLRLDEMAQTAPLLDLFQGAQDRLYSRLFQS